MNAVSSGNPVVRIYRWAGLLAGILQLAAALCVAVMVSVTMSQIILRDVFFVAIPWASELARTLFVWAVMIGIAVATWMKAHIAVTILENSRSKLIQWAVRIIAIGCILVLSILLAVEGLSFAITNIPNVTASLSISLGIATSSVAGGGLFMSLFALLILLEELFPACREAGDLARSQGAGHE